MPEISRFFGIIIAMYYDEHAPPHFHAKYGEYEITVGIADGAVTGNSPGRAKGLVIEWLHLHKGDLSANWGESGESRATSKNSTVGVTT